MHKKRSIQNEMVIVLAVGFAAGTFFAAFPGRTYLGQLGLLSDTYRLQVAENHPDMWGLLLFLAAQRCFPALFLMLLGSYHYRRLAGMFLLLWSSFSLGVYWTGCILIYGVSGILLFLVSWTPHGMIYILGWLELIRVMLNYPNRKSAYLYPLSLLIMGAAAEAWIHPYFIRLIASRL